MNQDTGRDAPPDQHHTGELPGGHPFTIVRRAARIEVTANGNRLLNAVQEDPWAAEALYAAFVAFAEATAASAAAARADLGAMSVQEATPDAEADTDPDDLNRERAWRHLYPTIMALGAPSGVDFKGRVLTIQLDGGTTLVKAWARTLQLANEQRRDAASAFGWHVMVTGTWQGWSVILNGWDAVGDLLWPVSPSSVAGSEPSA